MTELFVTIAILLLELLILAYVHWYHAKRFTTGKRDQNGFAIMKGIRSKLHEYGTTTLGYIFQKEALKMLIATTFIGVIFTFAVPYPNNDITPWIELAGMPVYVFLSMVLGVYGTLFWKHTGTNYWVETMLVLWNNVLLLFFIHSFYYEFITVVTSKALLSTVTVFLGFVLFTVHGFLMGYIRYAIWKKMTNNYKLIKNKICGQYVVWK